MNELDLIESNDALLRFTEGGGSVPAEMHQQFGVQGMQGLGQTGAAGPWYKSPTVMTLLAVGLVAVGVTVYLAQKED